MALVGGFRSDSISLNVMPMLDVFSILILFLLMNFSADPLSLDLTEGVELPSSVIVDSLDELPTITISKSDIFINNKKIVSMEKGKIPTEIKSQGGIIPLFHELKKMSEANRNFAKDDSRANILTLEIDKEQRFDVIKSVMSTAQQAGFIRFKLMITKQF